MKVLLIAAHGSRKPAANAEIASLTEAMDSIAAGRFDLVRSAFLQLTEPLIPETIAGLVAEGAKEIVVFPFFIAAGSHVLSDIPAIISEARNTYPEVVFRVAPHLGACEGISRFILDAVARE
jgi:sirohydrochlorin ferrochelatase